MKTEQDYIREAAELAEGWRYSKDHESLLVHFAEEHSSPTFAMFDDEQPCLDALAAQLVRQVDKNSPYIIFMSRAGGTAVIWPVEIHKPETRVSGPDRTMNTIKAIVDSGILK